MTKTCPNCGLAVHGDSTGCPQCGGRWNEDGIFAGVPARMRHAVISEPPSLTVAEMTRDQLRTVIMLGVFQGVLLAAVIIIVVLLLIGLFAGGGAGEETIRIMP